VRKLDEEAARRGPVAPSERPGVALGGRPGAGSIAGPQPACDLAIATAGQRDEPLDVLGEEGLAEPRHALGARHVRMRDQPAQAPPPDLGSGEEDQVRSPNALGDAPQVLLDGEAVARQPGALGPRPGRLAVAGLTGGRGVATGGTAPPPTRTGDDDADRILDRGVEQLDLDADDRPISAARSTSSSGADAPSRNEKLVWLWSSA